MAPALAICLYGLVASAAPETGVGAPRESLSSADAIKVSCRLADDSRVRKFVSRTHP